MKKFLEAVSKSDDLIAKIGTMTKEDLIALARERDIELIEADLKSPMASWMCEPPQNVQTTQKSP